MEKTTNVVQILIKAPNQSIQDQTIKCEPHWTIKELKHHLADVYPNKPHPDGQKLIYSGHLLPDDAILTDILQTYDGQQNNTLHLVCSIPRDTSRVSCQSVIQKDRVEKKPSSASHLSSNETDQVRSPQMSNGNSTIDSQPLQSENDLRRRMPYIPFTSPMPPQSEGYDQQHLYQQMLWMQQAYMQYMAHYMQLAYNVNVRNPIVMEQRDSPVPPQQPAPQNRGGEDVDDEDGHVNRDWVEWVTMISRVIVLFTVVYFYSSPIRFVTVTTMAFFLYHLGMLRWRPVQNNNNNNVNNNNRVEFQPDDAQDGTVPEDPPPVHIPQESQYPPWISVVWTFLSSFFLSLIPEQREV